MMGSPYVQNLLVGIVKQLGKPGAKNPLEREWESGIYKNSVNDEKWLSKNGLTGDEVADKKNHGGPEKAVFAYSTKHYDAWKVELDINIGIGAMGENIALDYLDEETVCIGDTYRFGDAIIQVSQPRRPCWKPARRFKIIDFALRIQNTGRTGWYFRVLKEGFVQEKQNLILLERPYPEWTISKCNDVMYVKKSDLQLAEELASCEFLAPNWKQTLSKRLEGRESSIEKRVFGPNKD